jgi:hypothetical protein
MKRNNNKKKNFANYTNYNTERKKGEIWKYNIPARVFVDLNVHAVGNPD